MYLIKETFIAQALWYCIKHEHFIDQISIPNGNRKNNFKMSNVSSTALVDKFREGPGIKSYNVQMYAIVVLYVFCVIHKRKRNKFDTNNSSFVSLYFSIISLLFSRRKYLKRPFNCECKHRTIQLKHVGIGDIFCNSDVSNVHKLDFFS